MTPRRILLLVAGFLVFGTAYAIYARFFGWLDGLPLLPGRLLASREGTFRPPERPTSPTIERLKTAFGDSSPETEPAFYPTQLEFRNGDTSIVLAAGPPPSNPNSNRVTLSPFSVAAFGKPRPPHLLQPGEVTEVTTFHSDKAVLEFDRVITNPAEMNSAKLVRLELISDPEQSLPDPRQGRVHITNNQRSADPNRRLVLRTVGPVFYRDPKAAAGTPSARGPDVWTDAPVEVVDRGNLPRRHGTDAATATTGAEEVRTPAAVADILTGRNLPPPTVTAVGLRVYLEAENQPKGAPAKKGSAGFSGVRRVELLEQVLLNLWVEGGQSLVGSGPRPATEPEPDAAATAVAGTLLAGRHAARTLDRALLQVQTRGPFFYDAVKNLARFDVLPQADPNLPNDVQVTKVPPRPGTQTLFSQVLELEFNGPPVGGDGKPAPKIAPKSKPAAAAKPAAAPSGPKFSRLHAWTYTPGRFLTVSSDENQLEAYGQDLVHEQATERTLLTGSPLYAVQQRNVLTAGGPKQPAVLVLEPDATGGPDRKAQATVRGPGRVELYDEGTKGTTITAAWQTSMAQTREVIGGRPVDLFTLTDAAKFEDVRADYWLKGNVIKLWLAPAPPADGTTAAGGTGRALPHRVQAIGNVTEHSADIDIEQADHLNVLFRDATPPAPLAGPVAPVSPAPAPKEPAAGGPPKPPGVGPPKSVPADPVAAPKEPGKPKPPTRLRARTVDTLVARYPAPPTPGAAGNPPGSSGVKYQLEKARCEGMVSVHQDPADPAKPRGTDIVGSLLLIDSTPDGSIMTVFGWDDRPGEVHNEGTSLIGPKVLLDQLHNRAAVEGRGSLVMPAGSDLTGAELKTPEVVVIHWRDGMRFDGALKKADFFGKVNAAQGGSWVVCHTMQVVFDRPVYFSPANRPGAAPRPPAGKGPNPPADDKPKIDIVYCYPAPADTADNRRELLVTFNQVDRDPVTGHPLRRQQLTARELTLRAQVREEGRAEPYRLVLADGPGVVRTWQPGAKDADPAAAPPKQPGAAPAPAESEMKLTVVNFTGRMTGRDMGRVYQDATFHDNVQVINVPTDNPELVVERHKLPPKAILLTCSEKLVVSTHRRGEEPAQQRMDAHGNAYLQNEEYDGWGDVITHDGKVVVFDSTGAVPARIKSRFKGNDNAGRQIVFDRSTNHYKVIDSVGGTLTSSPGGPPPKSATPPKKP